MKRPYSPRRRRNLPIPRTHDTSAQSETQSEIRNQPIAQLSLVTHKAFTMIDETGWLMIFDITLGIQLAESLCPVQEISLSECGITIEEVRQRNSEVDEEHAMTTDLSSPLLFFHKGVEDHLIDGHHRLTKALLLGVDRVPVYILNEEQAESILVLKVAPQQTPL